jgi:hypothetical protein
MHKWTKKVEFNRKYSGLSEKVPVTDRKELRLTIDRKGPSALMDYRRSEKGN